MNGVLKLDPKIRSGK